MLCKGRSRTAQLGDNWEPLPILCVTTFPGPCSSFSEVTQFIYLTRHNYNNKYFVERSFLRSIRIKIYNDTMRRCVGMGATPIFFATTVVCEIKQFMRLSGVFFTYWSFAASLMSNVSTYDINQTNTHPDKSYLTSRRFI